MSASGAFIMGRYIAERSALGRKIFRVLKPDSRGPLSRSANVTNGSTSDVSNGWKADTCLLGSSNEMAIPQER
jgi:hypothetical protein